MCIQNCPGRMDIKDSKSDQQGLNSSHCSFTLMISFILQDNAMKELFMYPIYDSKINSVHGIFQARVPEWVAISFSRDRNQ